MVLKIEGIKELFPKRTQIEGTTPEKHDIGWTEQLTQDISKSLAINTFTLNHTQTNSILNMFDADTSNYVQFRNDGSSSLTTTLILDLGIETFVHNTHLYWRGRKTTGGEQETAQVKLEYSSDNSTYTEIINTTDTFSNTGTFYHDEGESALKYRYLKLTIISTSDSNDCDVDIYELRLIR